MGFEVTKKNVKDASSFLSQSEPKKTETEKKEKPKSGKPPHKLLAFA